MYLERRTVKHEIHVTNTEPTRSKAYPTSYHLQKEIDKEIEVMLKTGSHSA